MEELCIDPPNPDLNTVGGEWSASRPGRFTPGKNPPPRTRWIGSWVSLRTGLHAVERRKILTLPGLEL
jgi:hypothetical protein